MTGRGHQFQWRCAAQSGPLPTSRQDNLPLQAGRGQTAFRSPAPGARNRGSRPIAAAGSREGRLGSTTSRSKPPHDRPAVRPEADTMNQTVRSRCTPPEWDSFKPNPLRASSNSLNYRASNIRTKMAVVRLFRRKGAERDEKRPEVGISRGPGGSDNLPGMAAFCGIPTAVPNGRIGGAKATRTVGTVLCYSNTGHRPHRGGAPQAFRKPPRTRAPQSRGNPKSEIEVQGLLQSSVY
jgi:hypothetical protein